MSNIGRKISGSKPIFARLPSFTWIPSIVAPAKARALATGSPLRRRPPGEREGVSSTLVSHNVVVDGHRTTVRLEPVIWGALKDIAHQQKISVHDLVSWINRQRTASGLTAAIRAYVVVYLSTGLREALSTGAPQDRQTFPVRSSRRPQ